ncbi:MAG TPA: PAS domain S-box protein [Roseiarcus sp.]|nr:PAS domain S-box protein [Roseiarcus sp.]
MSTLARFDALGADALGAALAGNRHCAIVYARADGAIGFWNAGAEALFGHAPAEALGKRVDLIVPEEYRAMHWAGFARAIGSPWRGSASWSPVEGLHKSGDRVGLEVFLTPIQEADERARGVLGFFRVPTPAK